MAYAYAYACISYISISPKFTKNYALSRTRTHQIWLSQPALLRAPTPFLGLIQGFTLTLTLTHELAEQIVRECRRLGKALGLRTAALIGGVSKFEQFKELRAGAEIVVGTPGRMLEMAGAKGGLSMARVSFVVVDEADRMFAMGFEEQARPWSWQQSLLYLSVWLSI